MHLGARLETIGSMVQQYSSIADIGTDHAYLPVWLIKNGIIHHAIAADIAAGPCAAARHTITQYGLQLLVDIRQGDGLAVLEPGEVANVILAGMGASTMIEILEARPRVVQCLNSLILQPMIGVAQLREWAQRNNYTISAESLCREAGHFYVVLVIKPNQRTTGRLSSLELELGPCLLKHRPPLLREYVEELLRHYQYQLGQMRQGKDGEHHPKYQQLQQLCKELEVLQHG